MRAFFQSIRQAMAEFIEDDCMSHGAAIAYYSIFALPPLLVIVFLLASYAGVSSDRINRVVKKQLGIPGTAAELAAEQREQRADSPEERSALQLESVAERAGSSQMGRIGIAGRLLGIGLLIFTATSLFAQLQVSLNRVWEVTPDPTQGGVRAFIWKRILSLGMILVFAFLLLISMVVSTGITEVVIYLQGHSPSIVSQVTGFALDHLLTLGLGTLVFAAIFKVLPDADMSWRDMWLGGAVTALLFIVGKGLIAFYLRRANLGSSWGETAGSIVAILAWLYYTSLIVLFGAELTQVWARRYGHGVRPAEGAARAVHEERLERN